MLLFYFLCISISGLAENGDACYEKLSNKEKFFLTDFLSSTDYNDMSFDSLSELLENKIFPELSDCKRKTLAEILATTISAEDQTDINFPFDPFRVMNASDSGMVNLKDRLEVLAMYLEIDPGNAILAFSAENQIEYAYAGVNSIDTGASPTVETAIKGAAAAIVLAFILERILIRRGTIKPPVLESMKLGQRGIRRDPKTGDFYRVSELESHKSAGLGALSYYTAAMAGACVNLSIAQGELHCTDLEEDKPNKVNTENSEWDDERLNE